MGNSTIRATFEGVAYRVMLTEGRHHWDSGNTRAVGGGPSPHKLIVGVGGLQLYHLCHVCTA